MLGTGILIANGNQLAGDRGHWWRAPDWPVARMDESSEKARAAGLPSPDDRGVHT